MNDVINNTAEMQVNAPGDQNKGDLQTTADVKAFETSVRKLIARKGSVEKMHAPRSIIGLRDKLDEQMLGVQKHLEGLSELGLSDDPLEAFEGMSELKRWRDYLKKLGETRKLLVDRASTLIKEEEVGH